MIDLYTAPTPNGHKASCTLEALEISYETHFVNISRPLAVLGARTFLPGQARHIVRGTVHRAREFQGGRVATG